MTSHNKISTVFTALAAGVASLGIAATALADNNTPLAGENRTRQNAVLRYPSFR